jgi:hypothetical protein
MLITSCLCVTVRAWSSHRACVAHDVKSSSHSLRSEAHSSCHLHPSCASVLPLRRRLCSGAENCILNVISGFCVCLDAELHQLCAHLLAAEMHPDISKLCMWRAQLPSPPPEDQWNEKIEVRRVPPLALPDDVPEPLRCFGVEAAVRALSAAAQWSRAGDGCSEQFSPELREAMCCAAAISRFAPLARHVQPEQLLELLPLLRTAAAACNVATPRFADANPSSRSTFNRQPTDKSMKPLFKHRKKSPAARSQPVVQKLKKVANSAGRKGRKFRDEPLHFLRPAVRTYPLRRRRGQADLTIQDAMRQR